MVLAPSWKSFAEILACHAPRSLKEKENGNSGIVMIDHGEALA